MRHLETIDTTRYRCQPKDIPDLPYIPTFNGEVYRPQCRIKQVLRLDDEKLRSRVRKNQVLGVPKKYQNPGWSTAAGKKDYSNSQTVLDLEFIAEELDHHDSWFPHSREACIFQEATEFTEATDLEPHRWVGHFYEEKRVYFGQFKDDECESFTGRGFKFTITNRAVGQATRESVRANVPGVYEWCGYGREATVSVFHQRYIPYTSETLLVPL